MTMNSITSKQRRQYNQFTQDGARKALTIVCPDKDGLQRLFGRGDEWQNHLIAGIVQLTALTPSCGLAKSILGADFITPEEVTKARPSIVYTNEQIMAFAENLPSEDVLKWCKDNGYAIMPAPPTAMSTNDVQKIPSDHFYLRVDERYVNERFAHEDMTSFGCLMIKKTPVTNSTRTVWSEQNKLLSASEIVPNAAEMSWFISTYFEIRGIKLFPGIYVRTSSLDSRGDHILVGFSFSVAFRVSSGWDDDQGKRVGLSTARKHLLLSV